MDRDDETLDAGIDERARVGHTAAAATAKTARLVSLAVPSRALGRNRRDEASVLAGGSMTTHLFFMYFVGRLVVTAPVSNSALHAEIRNHGGEVRDERVAAGGRISRVRLGCRLRLRP